jgi:hypothetical protein
MKAPTLSIDLLDSDFFILVNIPHFLINNSASHDTEISTSSNIRNYVSMNIYYVYAYLRNKDSSTASANTPYYIGKGKANRVYNNHGKIPVPKNKEAIQIIASSLDESAAHLLEMILIAQYGRKDLGTGILLNQTNGGEGMSGPKSEEHKAKIGAANKGKIVSDKQRIQISKKLTGRHRTKESIAKGAASHKALNRKVVHSTETLQKISTATRGVRKDPQSKEHCAKKVAARKGKPLLKQVCRLIDGK